MGRRSQAAVAAILLLPALIGAGPSSDGATPPDGVQYELTIAAGESGTVTTTVAEGAAVNAWAHMSVWDPNTCTPTSPENRCDRTLIQFVDSGVAMVGFSTTLPVADYDLVVFTSDESGYGGRTILGEVVGYDVGEGGELTFDVDEGDWVLAVMFYRTAGGGYDLTAALD